MKTLTIAKIRSFGNKIIIPILALMSLAGIVLVFRVTVWGPGVGSDATVYIFSARNLLAGQGLGTFNSQGQFQLITHYAPFFPLVLSFIGCFGIDPLNGAHWLNALLFGATIFVVGITFYRLTGDSWIAGLLCGLLIVSPDLLNAYAWAMSEPLFIGLSWLSLGLLWRYLSQPDQKTLLAAATLAGLTYLTRYVGVSWVGCGILAILLLSAPRWKSKLTAAGIFGLIGVLPTFSWWAYYYSQHQGIANRSFNTANLAERLAAYGRESLEVLLSWVPFIQTLSARAWLFTLLKVTLCLGLLAGVAILLCYWRSSRVRGLDDVRAPRILRFLALLTIYLVCYLGFLGVTRLLTDPPITLDSRMFSPLHVIAIFILGLIGVLISRLWSSRGLRWLMLVGLAVLLGSYTLRASDFINRSRTLGLGLSGPQWKQSETLRAASNLPTDVEIITNEGAAVLFYTGRPISVIGELFLSTPLTEFTCYGEGTTGSDQEERFRHNGAALVLFDSAYRDFEALYHDRTAERVAALTACLVQSYRGNDGTIYFYPSDR